MSPKISVIMPTYNRAFCIEKAIVSLINQTDNAWELIIIDDGSTDGTEDLIQNKYAKWLNNKKIQYIKTKHIGVSAARNIGIRHASGDWIGYLDTDNLLYPQYISTFIENIKLHPHTSLFYAQIQHHNSKIIIGEEFDYQKLLKSNYIDLGAVVHSKALFKKRGGFDEKLKRLVDYELLLKFCAHVKPVFIAKILVDYNDNDDITRITNTEDLQCAMVRIAKKHKNLKQKLQRKDFETMTTGLLKAEKMLHLISKSKYNEKRNVALIKASGLFDSKWYVKQNPELRHSKIKPVKHYYKFGWRSGLNPSPLFDGNDYLRRYPDVAAAGINPLLHYIVNGAKEGRTYLSIDGVLNKHRSLWQSLKYALTYPIRVQEEYYRLKAEIKELEKQI